MSPVLSLDFLSSLVVESEDPSSHSTHLREVRKLFPYSSSGDCMTRTVNLTSGSSWPRLISGLLGQRAGEWLSQVGPSHQIELFISSAGITPLKQDLQDWKECRRISND